MPTPSLPSYVIVEGTGYGHARESAVQRTATDLGIVKQTKVRTRTMVKRSTRFLIKTLANYNSFMTWFRTDISEGATWFTWTDPIDSTSKLARIVAGSLSDRVADDASDNWIIACVLETWSA